MARREWIKFFPATLANPRRAEPRSAARDGATDARATRIGPADASYLLYHPLGPQSFRLTSEYSPRRRHPVLRIVRPHRGTDFGIAAGCAVYAAHGGELSYRRGAIVVTLDRPDAPAAWTRLQTRYRHVVPADDVEEGTIVSTGDLIGWVNRRERGTTGSHLHFEVLVWRAPSFAPETLLGQGWTYVDPERMSYTTVLEHAGPAGTTRSPIESAHDVSRERLVELPN